MITKEVGTEILVWAGGCRMRLAGNVVRDSGCGLEALLRQGASAEDDGAEPRRGRVKCAIARYFCASQLIL